jgi:hypothetical protein
MGPRSCWSSASLYNKGCARRRIGFKGESGVEEGTSHPERAGASSDIEAHRELGRVWLDRFILPPPLCFCASVANKGLVAQKWAIVRLQSAVRA